MKKIVLLIFLSSILILFLTNYAEAGVRCKCVDTSSYDCKYSTNCAAARVGYGWLSPAWSCLIMHQNCECDYQCYISRDPGGEVSECSNSYVTCKMNACPATTSYNGEPCELIDDCCGGFGCLEDHCRGIWGRWDASQQRCVKCEGKKQGYLIADSTGRKCFDVKDGGDCDSHKWTIYKCEGKNTHNCDYYTGKGDDKGCRNDPCCVWVVEGGAPYPAIYCKNRDCKDLSPEACSKCEGCSVGCALLDYNSCESACGADEVCDEQNPGYATCDGNIKKTCNENCEAVSTDCSPYACREEEKGKANCLTSCQYDSDCASGYYCCKKTGECKQNREDCPCDDNNHCVWSGGKWRCDTTTKKCVNCTVCSGGTERNCNNGGAQCEFACGADEACDEKPPGWSQNPYSCDNNCKYHVDCSYFTGAYPDSTENPVKCSKPDYYKYEKYSSAYQVREYKNKNSSECECNVAYDSWIEEVSVNKITQGTAQVFQNYDIIANIVIKNVGSKEQTDWFVGVEFWNVSDFNNAWETRDGKGRVDLYFDAKNNRGGCANERGSCPEGATCEVLTSEIALKPQKNITVRCRLPASFYPITTGNQRIMVWAHTRISNFDADKDGRIDEWWDDALARTLNITGQEGPAPITINISEPFSIGRIEYPPTGVIVNSLVTVTWQLWETLESPEKCGREQYRCHTNLHCFPPGIVPPDENDVRGWIDECDPYVGRPSTPCVSSTMEDQIKETYTGKIFVDKAGNWTCRIHLRNKNRDVFSPIFKIEVKDIPNEPYCVIEPSSKTVYSDRKANFTLKLKNGKDTSITWRSVITYNKLHKQCADYLEEEVVTVDNLVERGLSRDGISLECYYPTVQKEIETYFKVAIPYQIGSEPKSTACFSYVKVLPPLPCNITSFQLLGTLSGTPAVRKGETVKAIIQGNNCEGKTAKIKDISTGNLMCTCTFSGSICINQTCFVAPEKLGVYTYEVSASPPSLNASIFVFAYGLNILNENYGSYLISWKLLPEWPTKEKEFFLFLNAKDSSGNPLTPSTTSFLYTYPGYTTTQYSFSYFPNLYLNVGKFWVINEKLPKSYSIPFDNIQIPGVKISAREVVNNNLVERMDGLIVPGEIIIDVKQTDWNKDQKRLALLVSSNDQNANLSYRVWKVSDLSLYKQGDFTKYGTNFQAEIIGLDLDQFFVEILASSRSTGGKVLAFGLEKPNFLLNVTPSAISGESYPNKTFKTNITLKNIGNSDITDLLVEASDEIKQFTSISFKRELKVGESQNVSLTFEIGEKNFNGKIFVKYAGKTISVPVTISIKETPKISVSPLEILIAAVSGQRFEQKITLTNNGKVAVTIYSIEVYGVENTSTNFYGTDTIQPSKSKTYSVIGTLFKSGEYEGYVRIESDAGIKTVSLKVKVTSILPSCGDGKCESSKGENKDNCCLDCGCPTGKVCDRALNLCVEQKCGNGVCDVGENSTSCPKDCYCGDGVCNIDENRTTCPRDCPSVTCNNNGICEEGESYPSCSDCPGFYCGNKICEPGEEITCSQDCPQTQKELESKINNLTSRVSSLEKDMESLGNKVNSTLWSELGQIKNLLNEAKNALDQGDYSTALSKYNEANRRYQTLRQIVDELLQKFIKPSSDFSTILIILVIVGVVAGIFIVLWKFGYLKIKLWKKPEEEYYY